MSADAAVAKAARARTRTIVVDPLARIEGEAELHLKLKGNQVIEIQVKVVEPPRLFEGVLRGRAFTEAPDISARICGICPVAYQMSSVQALERICGVTVDGQLRALRRLLYCGEWIESHVLHVYMLHAPDFLGYDDVLQLAKDFPNEAQRGLRLKKIGNEIVRVLGGREIHPINVRVGGFYRLPTRPELEALVEPLTWARDAALETVRWVATLEFPEVEQQQTYVALSHPDEYAIIEGRVRSTRGLDIDVSEYDEHFTEEHVAHSTALHSVGPDRQPYVTGPLARYTLNFERLPAIAQQAARDAGLGPTCRNPFKSIIVRSVETVFACDEALRIIREYESPERASVSVAPRAGVGSGCTEAPRGICYHRYRIDQRGTILDAKIVPPTSQNLMSIEQDVALLVPQLLDLPQEQMVHRCEQAIRNYDPCISCSTHFLRLRVERE
jgi:coenzyme F420-reducing hydrogenase alpha subunit